MAKYTERLSAPAKTNKYYYSNDNIYHRCGMGMYHNGRYAGNCTAYAWGRLWEITGTRYMTLTGNAEDMFESAKKSGLQTGPTPKLGSLIVWASGKTHNSADGCGHIAVVEEINSDGSIVISESGWDAYLFKTEVVPKPYKRGNYTLLGFVYPGINFEPNKATSISYMHNGINYAPVFNAEYYANKYEDIKNAFGNDYNAMFKHFCEHGMKEQRIASAGFNILIYKNQKDLQKAFGDDYPKYYEHFIEYGINESRVCV